MRLLFSASVCAISCALLSGCAMTPTTTDSGTVQGEAIHGVSMGGRAPISGQKVYLLEATTTGYISSYAQSSALGGGFSQTWGVAVDSGDNVFVADNGNALVKEIPSGCASSGCVVTLGGGFSSPIGMAVDGSGNVYVGDLGNDAIYKIPPGCVSSGCVITLGGGFSGPEGVAVDKSGKVYVADKVANAVKEIPSGCVSSGCVLTLGGGFSGPRGVAVDQSGNVYVGDFNNNAVKEIPLGCTSSGCVLTLASTYTTGGGFHGTYGLAVDGSGNVFVDDFFNSLVKEIPLGCLTSSCIVTVGSGFQNPRGVALDGYGNLIVADTSHSRVVKETVSYTHQASKSLLTSATGSTADSIGYYVTSDANGNWSIGGDYTCDSGAQVYVYGLGGNSGAGGPNTGIGLMAALGQCPSSAPFNFATADPFVLMNEVTTVAAAYAMAGYATDATHVSSNNTSLAIQGMANAFANAGSLATVSSGTANASVPNVAGSTVPQTTINTLANILAACVNSLTGSTNCTTTLFPNARSAGSSGTVPTDTATAAINIAHNPGNAISTLYGLQAGIGSAPYPTDLTGQPNDFSIGLNFTGGGLNGPYAVAIDGSGNVWITNNTNSTLTELSSTGAAISTPAGYTGGGMNEPLGLAIDGLGNAWVANYTSNAIVKFSSTGGVLSGSSGFSGSGQYAPEGIAVDGSNNVWAPSVEYNGGVTEYTNLGVAASPYTGGGLSYAVPIAIDVSGNAWVGDQYPLALTELSSAGVPSTGSPYTGGGLNAPSGLAIDAQGNIWVSNEAGASVSEFSPATNSFVNGSSGYTGGGISYPNALAIDGAGNVWVANGGGAYLTELSSTGTVLSGSNGYTGGTQTSHAGVAIDGSGNVWVPNSNNSVTELIGAATPVVTPMVANLQSPYGAHAVNVP